MILGTIDPKEKLRVEKNVDNLSHFITDEIFQKAVRRDFQLFLFGRFFNESKWSISQVNGNSAESCADLYLTMGLNSFAKMDGAFTILIINNDGSKLLVRDHHGTHLPIYYNHYYFSTSLTELTRTPHFQKTVNYSNLTLFLAHGYIPSGSSSFEGVNKLAAGTCLLIDRHGNTITENLFPQPSLLSSDVKEKSLEEYSEEFGLLHADAIKRRIGSSDNVGILLSGGYDSGSNLAALRQVYDGRIRSYSIGFKNDKWSELPLAQCMSDKFHTEHHTYEIDGSELMDLPRIVDFLGDPFVEGGLMVNYCVMKMIGEDKPDILLGGDGSDQYFGTSARELALLYLLKKKRLQPFAKLAYQLFHHEIFDKNSKLYKLHFHLDRILNIMEGDCFGFPSFRMKRIVQEQTWLEGSEKTKENFGSFNALYHQHNYECDIDKTINQVILFKASRMANLFENTIAFPFMDLELYHFLETLPLHYKSNAESLYFRAKGHLMNKYLLKQHYKPFLPEAITAKKKQGGFAPMPVFFKDNKQRTLIKDFILSSNIFDHFLNRKPVEDFLFQYDRDTEIKNKWFWYEQNKAIQYFNLLTLVIWWEQYINDHHKLSFLK